MLCFGTYLINQMKQTCTLYLKTEEYHLSQIFSMPTSYWLAIGYICIDNFAVRVDVFERIFFLVRQKLKSGPFLESSDLMNPIGCNSQQLTNILSFCGCQSITLGDEKKIFFYEQKIQKKIEKIR